MLANSAHNFTNGVRVNSGNVFMLTKVLIYTLFNKVRVNYIYIYLSNAT